MPGASLWLIPPSKSDIHEILSTLIAKTVPARFPELDAPPNFPPHLTLTSDIAPETVGENPQEWLDGLSISVSEPPSVNLQSLDVSQQFFKKLTLSSKKAPLQELAVQARAAAVEGGDDVAAMQWFGENYAPHVSLLYADIDIGESRRREVLDDLIEAGVRLETEGLLGGREREGHDGWDGGQMVLVETWRELKDWTIVAERTISINQAVDID